MTLQSGATIAGRYRLLRLVATGGMGQVWEAIDQRLDRRVAVKVLKAELSDNPEFLERFRIEARTTASLNHPGIAGVYDYGETTDPAGAQLAYLVMEFVDGEPLSAVLRRMGVIPLQHALDMLEQTGRALQVAHRAGLVHRDVKPGNILITPTGQVKITDFGIAKAIDAAPVTRTGMVMGTAQYIAPEQALGQDATAASDVYALGVVGYEALSGQRPFQGDGTLTVAMKHIQEPPRPLPSTLPPNVRELIEIALAKDPAARYANGGAFADAVAAVRAGRRPPRPLGGAAAAGPATGATQKMTGAAALPPTQMMGAETTRAVPGRVGVDPDEDTGWSTGQKALAWGGGALLVLAAIVAGGLILSNSPGSDGGHSPSTVSPPLTTVYDTTEPPVYATSEPPIVTTTTQPPVTTTAVTPTTTPSPTTSEAPTTTAESTTTEATTAVAPTETSAAEATPTETATTTNTPAAYRHRAAARQQHRHDGFSSTAAESGAMQ
ncbi:serine/threonine-protein kinase [Speluncibacter jeojiensis]|uniref:non-specific serine/threonine protein kinase n=1 Tax=Speluncibacter jeojiensis TaxID=2710754 RepID=A0A9X4RFX1_9ACTN|nr:serine/threonine protein kinase [Corynebacteriales bacterium D3-21]